MPEYSISQLGKFEECALQYKFIYVDGIKRYEEGVEAFLGQRFHDAMEWFYKERAFRIVPLEELLGYYEKDWATQWHAEVGTDPQITPLHPKTGFRGELR